MKTATGVLLVVAGLVALAASVAGLAVTASDEPGTAVVVAICAGLIGGVMLCIVGAERLSERGRRWLGFAIVLLGVSALGAGVGWLATVWDNDAARMDASVPAGGLVIGGILAVVVGLGTVSKNSVVP